MNQCSEWTYTQISPVKWEEIKQETNQHGIQIRGNSGTIEINKWGIKKVHYHYNAKKEVGTIQVLDKNPLVPCTVFKKFIDNFFKKS